MALRPPPLSNTGSVARDMLASERTFLAWARTGLGFIALGIAIEKVEAFASLAPTLMHLENSRTKVAAGALVAAGSLCVGHGARRYFTVWRGLEKGVFRPNGVGVVGLSAAALGVAFGGILLVLENDGGRVKERRALAAAREGAESKARHS
ncbi:Hypothetical protein R9X50_00439800 [Acrodontium crateriforme]|uniref:DUF202 domain-containing protein n=1 Tax=Acrodontium crateriforme TaxID=150365 RepID=A0AAQ3R513_9PEZI|nr:Hypothetical protein R9X50_00439800 [Acrodontium crateriforme]